MNTVRYFSEELQQAKKGSPLYAIRAPWVWQILVSCAVNQKVIWYEQFGEYMGIERLTEGAGGMLHPILLYCQKNELPYLTSIVVSKITGRVSYESKDIQTNNQYPVLRDISQEDWSKQRMEVFRFGIKWLDIIPPSVEEYFSLLQECGKYQKGYKLS